MSDLLLTLHREFFFPSATFGSLRDESGAVICQTLEDADRQLENGSSVKIPGETAIPRGHYEVIITYSRRFNVDMPLLLEVPQFSGVRLHYGNAVKDTAGCPLLGMQRGVNAGGEPVLFNSREAYRRVFALIDAALDAGRVVRLTVE